MHILGIETATRAASVAAVFDDKILVESSREVRLTHSETLLPQIEKVLEISEAENKIEVVAVSIGPGSFTGLRIGLATAKALAYAWNVKIIGVPTLQALAYNFPAGVVAIPMLDAQKNRAYFQKFKDCRKISEIEILPIDEIVRLAGEIEDEVCLCGDVTGKIKIELPENVKIAPANLRMPRAANVALCARDLISAGKIDNVMNLEPLYIRRSEAEVLWELRQK